MRLDIEFNKFSNTGAGVLDIIYHLAQKFL